MPSNHQVMYHLQDALSLVPDLIPLTKSFHIETHDQEMVGNVIFRYFFIRSLKISIYLPKIFEHFETSKSYFQFIWPV